MLLAIDIGNTNIVLGVFEGTALSRSWRLATARERTADELGLTVSDLLDRARIAVSGIDGAVLASVVPQLTGPMIDMSTRYLGVTPLNVDADADLGMPNLYEHPSEVGADRLVNGVAAYETYGRARQVPLIVVDFGTATTFDCVSPKGEYLGGVICPGIQISADALFARAAKLPRVEVAKPPKVVGRNTVSSMQSGIVYGYVGLVDGMIARLEAELAFPCALLATGGLARLIAPLTARAIEFDDELTLTGLRILYERNQG